MAACRRRRRAPRSCLAGNDVRLGGQVMAISGSLPELTFELAREIGEFPPYTFAAGPDAIAEYCAITGDHSPLYAEFLPPGFAGIFGRDAYLRHHRMPPGGVLLAQDI